MDLLTYLQTYEPHELVKCGGNEYSTRTHDSLKISNGLWYRHKTGEKGRSALDYLIKIRGMPLPDAVERILGRMTIEPPPPTPKEKREPKKFVLPPRNPTCKRMTAYLQSRGIDPLIMKHCYDMGLLYESAPYGNAVFIGLDDNGTPAYAALRGAKFMGEAAGSQKQYSFGVPAIQPSQTVHLFESPTDLLSYATLMRMYRRDPWRDNLLSLSGVSKLSETLPVALEWHLERNPDTRAVICRFDNDDAGHGAAAGIAELLAGQCEVGSRPPPSGKDYNEYLCGRLELQRNLRRREYVR